MEKETLKVLFLATWYPNRLDSMLGLFVQRHALAVAKYAQVSVVSVVSVADQKEVFEVETNSIKNLTEIVIYYRKATKLFSFVNVLVNAWRYISAHIAAWKILQSTDSVPDITHVHILTRAGVMALFFKIRYKIPYIITEHWSRYLPHHGGYKGMLRKQLTKKVIKHSEGVSTVSKALKSGMNAAKLLHNNWQVIPNVVDVHFFKPLSLKKEIYRFSHISCFEEKSKNMSGILHAAKLLHKQGFGFELMMIGDGPDWNSTVKLSNELGLKDIVKFTGVLEGEELLNAMNMCNSSIIFSHYETFSIVIPENLACGIPVIATKVGGIPEVLPEKFGILIPPNDIDALATAMKSMTANSNTYDQEAMIQYVEENFSYSEVGYSFVNMYKKALKV
jgi:glycosyltransferase involved in cell wall biosynthesis